MKYKIDFEKLNWNVPLQGIRHKYLDQEGIRVRLVEYDRSMPPHWCERPHFGIVLEGEFKVEFDHETQHYKKGEALFLPAGKDHRHMGTSVTDKTLVFFIELVE